MNLIEKWMKDPKKREKIFIFMTFAPLVASIVMVVGFILFLMWMIGVF
jgi:hypothetical protein